MKTIHKIGLGIGAGALALGGVAGAAGIARADDPTPSPAASASPGTPTSDQAASQGRDAHRGGGPRGDKGEGGGQLAKDLAAKLGLDETTVSQALTQLHQGQRPDRSAADQQSPEQRRTALAKDLAAKLGVDEAKVTAALDALDAERRAEHAAELKTRLDQAVTDGTLTRAEADAVTRAVEAGVIGGGPGGPRR